MATPFHGPVPQARLTYKVHTLTRIWWRLPHNVTMGGPH